jgi:4-diphosphocytidyl-2-C-methyl-D-erythritol kinase
MEEGPPQLRLAAPAKLNLSLRIVGRRTDGYHELESELVLLELADELSISPGDGLVVDPPARDLPPDPTANLAWRGLLLGAGGGTPGISLSLAKRIPVAAGLGGGSSDAAAAWRLARRRSRAADLPDATDLAALATIGADVPFFAAQVGAARVSGIGEQVEALDRAGLTAREVVLALAAFQLPTAAVFAELRRADWGSGGGDGNDLLVASLRLRPEISALMRAMRREGGEPRLTGSGPTLFALFDDPERADSLATSLQRTGASTVRTRLRLEPASIEAVADT